MWNMSHVFDALKSFGVREKTTAKLKIEKRDKNPFGAPFDP